MPQPTGEVWIKELEDLRPSSPGGSSMDYPAAPARALWHTTEAPSGNPAMFAAMHKVLTSKRAEPHILIDPITDRAGQYFPLNYSGRALQNYGSIRLNRVGRVLIQIEVIGYASLPFTRSWKPGPNWRAVMRALRSWGIPDVCPAGQFPAYPPGSGNRSWSIFVGRGGHYSHSQAPGNSHGDPGAISTPALFAVGAVGGAGGMGGGGPVISKPTTPAAPAQKEWWEMPIPDSEIDRIVAKMRPVIADEIHKTNGSWNEKQSVGQFLPNATADAVLARRGVPIDPGITPAVNGKPDERSTANAISMSVGFAWRAWVAASQALEVAKQNAAKQGMSQDDITAALNTALKDLGASGQTVINISQEAQSGQDGGAA